MTAEPPSLDFTQDDGAAIPQALLVNVYEGLVKIDEYGSLVPLLAKDWDLSDGNKVYTFHLHKGVKFSNGDEFTADDAVFSINRVKSDAWKPTIKAAMDVVQNVEAVDPYTLRVTLSRPSNLWLFQMATRIGAMFSKGDVDNLATETMGTGPYTVEDWTPGDSLELTRRDDYWGKRPQIEKVTLKYFKDPTAMSNSVRSGGLDMAGLAQASEALPLFADELKYRITEGTTNGEVVLAFNNEKEPFQDIRVRQAIKYGLDRQEIMDVAMDGRGQLIGSMVPPTDQWYEDLSHEYPYDPDKARKLLSGAGYESGELTLRLRLPSLTYATDAGQVVKSQLEEVGINVKIDVLEFPSAWLDEVFTKADYDMSIISHVEPWDMGAVFGDPEYYTRYDNPEFQQLLAEADAGSREEQITKLKEAAKILSEDAPADFLFLLPSLSVSTRDVEGLRVNGISEAFDVTGLSKNTSGQS